MARNVGNYNFVFGEATGNKRTAGTGTGSQESSNNNPNNGTYGSKYGYGGHINTVGYSSNHTSSNGGPRAVYLKYLGA